MITDRLIDRILALENPTCVGLDTALEYLPEALFATVSDARSAAEAIFTFNRNIIDAVADMVPAVKVQIAYYEELGPWGLSAFSRTVNYAKEQGLFVIADAKRNDIGATASRYAKAFLAEPSFGEGFSSDFLTVNGYLGTDGLIPFAEEAKRSDRGLFVLVKTSNPSSGELQDLLLADGRTVYEAMADMVASSDAEYGKYGFSRMGAVVGATHPDQAARIRARYPHLFFLIPGYGAQGGSAEMLKNCFDGRGLGGIVNNSRGILLAYRKRGGTYYDAARAAVLDMKRDLLAAIGGYHA